MYQKHTWSYSCHRINWYPYHMPTVLREKPWDTRLAFSDNTAYHSFYFQISKVRYPKTWTDDSNVIFILSSPMMNNDYKNILCGCHVWFAPSTCCCNKGKTVFLTPSLFFTDYPCLVPRSHFSSRPKRFGSRGPCENVSRPFASDTSPKRIDREGLGKRRTGTRQRLSLVQCF